MLRLTVRSDLPRTAGLSFAGGAQTRLITGALKGAMTGAMRCGPTMEDDMLNGGLSYLFLMMFGVVVVACGSSDQSTEVSTNLTTMQTSDKCRFLGDIYEQKVLLPSGTHKGECADTTSARSVIWDLTGFPQNADRLIVANISHDNTFWIAEFPRDGIEDVIFQMERFQAAVPAAHTQVRLRFKENSRVKLTNQFDASKTVYLRDFVLSVEALGQKGWTYDILRGMKNDYLAVYRITSLDVKYDWMVTQQKHEVIQWPLKISQTDKQKILPAYLNLANREQMATNYHTLLKNCTNQLFRILDSALDYGLLRIIPITFKRIDETYPVLVRGALDARGLIMYREEAAVKLEKVDPRVIRTEIRLPNLDKDPSYKPTNQPKKNEIRSV